MFENILIVYNEKLSEKHLATLDNVEDILKEKEIEFYSVEVKDLQFSCFKDKDLIITIGGDGTFIAASSFTKNQKILGINSEPEQSEGFLTSIKENELEKLKEILDGKYKIIKRQRIQVKRNNILLPKLALNDVYLGSSSQFHTSRYIINYKENKEEQRSSGILISTGSGSTAWYKSAGGNPFSFEEEKLKFLIREPYSGNLYKPTILNGEINENESLKIQGKRNNGGILALDSCFTYRFNNKDKVEISIYQYPLNVLQNQD